VDVVKLTPADYERVVNLWLRVGLTFRPQGRDSQEAFAQQLQSGVQTILGMDDEGKLIGVVVATHDSRKGWINRLTIDPDYQRQNLGSQLLEAAEQHLHETGIEVIAALIFETNTASIATFEKAGYSSLPGLLYFSKRPNWEA